MAVTTKRVLFNDGEGLDYNDLNDSLKLIENSAWDQHYPRLSDFVGGGGSDQYGLGYSLGALSAISCVGMSCAVEVGTGGTRLVTVHPGTVLVGTVSGTAPSALAETANYVKAIRTDGAAFNLAANASGLDRYDVIQFALSETSGGSESRDFEDATTRVHTSTAYNKRVSHGITFTVKQGTAGAGIPSPDANNYTYAVCLVPDGATNINYYDVQDFSYPGRVVRAPMKARDAMITTFAAEADRWSVALTNNSGVFRCFPPGTLFGNANARLLNVSMVYRSTTAPSAFTPTLKVTLGGDGDTTEADDDPVETLSTSITSDSTYRVKSWAPTKPTWMNGFYSGRTAAIRYADGISAGPLPASLCLKIAASTTGTLNIVAVTWIVAVD